MKLLRWVSSEEWRWLLWYRSLSPEQRKAFRRITQLLRQLTDSSVIHTVFALCAGLLVMMCYSVDRW